MAKRIVVANIKGGNGKTTIANELAFSFDRTGTPYSFFDLDGQRGGAHAQSEHSGAVVIIADTAGSIEADDLRDLARAADVVVIPTRSSKLDVYSFAETLQTVRGANPDAAVIIVHNGWNRYTLARDFGEWLDEHADGAPIYRLPQSEPVAMAMTRDVSVQEQNRRSSGARAMQTIVDAIRQAAGIEMEGADNDKAN